MPRITQRANWLRGDNTLSRLPFHIACKLADQVYVNFDDLRVQFWKVVADDPFVQGIYATEKRRLRGVREGAAPLAPESQQIAAVRRTINPGVITAELPATASGFPGGVIYGSEVNPESLKSYALHHIQPIRAGGGVYDLSNLLVVTPLAHTALLNSDYHYGCGRGS
jgi:hypothetical protein